MRYCRISPCPHKELAPNFDAIFKNNRAVVRDQFVSAVNKRIAEPGRSNGAIGQQNTEISNPAVMIDRHMAVQSATDSDLGALTNRAMRPNDRMP